MLDFVALEDELAGLLAGIGGFESVSVGVIRESVPVTQMPCLDVAVCGHKTVQGNSRGYEAAATAVIRLRGFDGELDAKAFKDLARDVCARLEGAQSGRIDAIREISADFEDAVNGGKTIHRLTARMKILAR